MAKKLIIFLIIQNLLFPPNIVLSTDCLSSSDNFPSTLAPSAKINTMPLKHSFQHAALTTNSNIRSRFTPLENATGSVGGEYQRDDGGSKSPSSITPAEGASGADTLLALRKERFDRFFFKNGKQTGYYRSLQRHFRSIQALVQGQGAAPVSIEIQPSGSCNISCRYCGFQEKRSEHKNIFLSVEDMERLINEIDEFNQKVPNRLTEVKFNGIFSEPLAGQGKQATMRGLKLSIEKGFIVGLFTNGIELDDAVRQILVNSGGKSAQFINISLDAGAWETYQKLKHSGAGLEQAKLEFRTIINNIRHLVRLRDATQANLNISVSCILQEENCGPDEITALVRLAKELGVDNIRFRYPYKKSVGAPDRGKIKKAYDTIDSLVRLAGSDNFSITQVYTEDEAYDFFQGIADGFLQKKTYHKCRVPLLRLTVAPDGNFYPCDHRGYKGGGALGSIKQGYESVMQSSERIEAIKQICPQNDERCAFCAMYNHYLNELFDFLEKEYEADENLFEWLAQSYGFGTENFWHGRKKKISLQAFSPEEDARVLAGVTAGQQQEKSLKQLQEFIAMHGASNSAGIDSFPAFDMRKHISWLGQAVAGNDRSLFSPRSFLGYAPGVDYDAKEAILRLLQNIEFIEQVNLLMRKDGFNLRAESFSEQKQIIQYMKELLPKQIETMMPEIKRGKVTEYDAFIGMYHRELVRIFGLLTDLTYEFYSAEVKDCIEKYLPGFIRYQLDRAMNEIAQADVYQRLGGRPAEEVIRLGIHYKIFCDMLLACIGNHLTGLKWYNEFLPRQLYIVLNIFQSEFQEFISRAGFEGSYVPALLLRDGEPLVYPFMGMLGRSSPIKPEFIFLNRLGLLTSSEREEYYSRHIDKASDYSKSLFAQQGKLYRFLNGDNDNDSSAKMEEVIGEVQDTAKKYLYSFLAEEGYGLPSHETVPEQVLDKGYVRFKDDAEKLCVILLAQRLLEFKSRDAEAAQVLRNIYSFLVPERVKADREQNIVFIDSGIKGSLPLLLSALVLMEDIPGASDAEKITYLAKMEKTPALLRNYRLRARPFIYGTTWQYRFAVPNAGFERFGFGGANSFIESLPRFTEFSFLNAVGLPEARYSGEISRYRAAEILKGVRRYADCQEKINFASEQSQIEDLILRQTQNDTDPIYIFMDLDNVVIEPKGYMGSVSWFITETTSIPDRDRSAKRNVFERYKQFMRYLSEDQGYETILNFSHMRETLRRRYPRRDVKIICFSARNENQRAVTEETLNRMGIRDWFDEILLSSQSGITKKERFEKYFENLGRGTMPDKRHAFVIDDEWHNIAYFLNTEGIQLVLFKDERNNYSGKGGLWFFEKGRKSLREGNNAEAKQYFINALTNKLLPLSAEDLKAMSQISGDCAGINAALLYALSSGYDWCSGEDFERINQLIVEMARNSSDAAFARELYDLLLKMHKKTGAFSISLNAVYEKCYREKAEDSLVKLWEEMERSARIYRSHREFYEKQNISLERVIENTILDYAFGMERGRNPVEYAVEFIKVLAPFFNKQEIQQYFPQGAVFYQEFQWINPSPQDIYEFYYGGEFYAYKYSRQKNGCFFAQAKTYPELKVQEANYTLQNYPLGKQRITSAIVFPTLYCNNGCPICMYASPPEPDGKAKDEAKYLSEHELNQAIRLMNDYPDLETVVIGGGGEPFLEFSAVERLIACTRASSIKIYTSGSWGKDVTEVNKIFLRLHRALEKRKKPVSLELNLSVDRFHVRQIGGENQIKYLENILIAFVKARERGRFSNVTLHLRGLSKDGNCPASDDSILHLLSNIKSSYPAYPDNKYKERESSYEALFSPNTSIKVSYNRAIFRNQADTHQLIDHELKNQEPFLFDRVFINGNGNVALGGYYEAIPLGNLQKTAFRELKSLSECNILSEFTRRHGLDGILKMVAEYDPVLIQSPPAAVTRVDMIKQYMDIPSLQLYIYYRVIIDFCREGIIDNGVLGVLGIDMSWSNEEIKRRTLLNAADVLDREKLKKINWGFKLVQTAGLPAGFGNIWADAAGEKFLRQRASGINNVDRIKAYINDMFLRKYAFPDADIKSIVVVGGYLHNRSRLMVAKDLDIIVITGHKGIRDFVPEQRFFFGNMFAPGVKNPPDKVCMWVISGEYLSGNSDNIIDIDLGLTLLSGAPVSGSINQCSPAPIIERIKQVDLFLNLLLKMNSDMDALKLYKRKLEIDAIISQLKKIAACSPERFLASANIADIDKKHAENVVNVLRGYFGTEDGFDLEKAWQRIDRVYRMVCENITEGGEAMDSGQSALMSAELRRGILEYARSLSGRMVSAVEELYLLQKDFLLQKPVQKNRKWLVDIFKANTPERSLEEHMSIAGNEQLDYSTACSLAMSTPYPCVLTQLFRTLKLRKDNFSLGQLSRIQAIIAANPAIAPSLQKNIRDESNQESQKALNANPIVLEEIKGDPSERRLLPIESCFIQKDSIASKFRQSFVNDALWRRFAGRAKNQDAENLLRDKGRLVGELSCKHLAKYDASWQELYGRYYQLYNDYCRDYLGEMILPRKGMTEEEEGIFIYQVNKVLRLLIDRVLYSSRKDGLCLYQTLDLKSFEALVEQCVDCALQPSGIAAIVKGQLDIESELRKRFPLPGRGGPLRVAMLTFSDRKGPSFSNRTYLTGMMDYTKLCGENNIQLSLFDLQFSSIDGLLRDKYDILVLDVRRESIDAFMHALDNYSLGSVSNVVMITGNYLSLPGAGDNVRKWTLRKIPDAIIVHGEGESALKGMVDYLDGGGRPLLLVPNVVYPTARGEIQTELERPDYQFVVQELYPFVRQMKDAEWFNYFVETSRGCSYGKCTFCLDCMLHGPGWRPMPMKKILRIFSQLNREGISTVFISDKDFWGKDYFRAEELSRRLKSMGNQVGFTVALRPDEIIEGEHLLESYKECGLSLVFLGAEAFDPLTLRRLNKGIDRQINLEAIRILREHNIDFGIGFMIDPLANIEELIQTLQYIEQYRLWGNVSSFFNILRIGAGTGYEKMAEARGLLDTIDERTRMYTAGFKDTRMAMVINNVQECLRSAPRLSFIYIISKRRLGKSEHDQREKERYNRHFAMLQKIDLDLLLNLSVALRSGHLDRLPRIKQNYLEAFQDTVAFILRDLDVSHPVSKNIHNYIEEQMRLNKVKSQQPGLPFPERVKQAYKYTREKVEQQAASGELPQAAPLRKGFNLSIVAGAKDITGSGCEITADTIRKCEKAVGDLIAIAGTGFTPVPSGRLRIVLFNRFMNEPFIKWEEIKDNGSIWDDCVDAVRRLRPMLPLDVSLKGLLVTEQGAVIVQGYVENSVLEEMRAALHRQFPDKERDIHSDRPFVSLLIGRLDKDKPISVEAWQALVKYASQYENEEFGSIHINKPVLQASSDFSGITPFEPAQESLRLINDDLLNSGPRILLTNISREPAVFGLSSVFKYRFPLTLNVLKGSLREKFGDTVNIELFDRQQEQGADSLLEHIKNNEFDMVGISAMIGEERELEEILSRIHAEIPHARRPLIVLGNALPGLKIDNLLEKYKDIIIVRGEGEYALNGLVEYLRGEKKLREVPNIAFVEGGIKVVNPVVPVEESDFGSPLFEQLEKIVEYGGLVQWEASRGCPWGKCSFCNRLNICAGWRGRSLEILMKELEELARRGVKQLFFADEDFIGADYDRAIAFSREILKRNISMDFIFSTSVRNIYNSHDSDEQRNKKIECLSWLKKAGVSKISLGLESGSDAQLRRYRKGVTVIENIRAVELLRKMGFGVIASIVMFEPFMSVQDMMDTCDFVEQTGVEQDLYLLGKVRISDANPYFVEGLRKSGKLKGKMRDNIHYEYDFVNDDVAEIVRLTDKWKLPRRQFNVLLNEQLQRFDFAQDHIFKVYSRLQGVFRQFDLVFLKLMGLSYHYNDNPNKFLSILDRLGATAGDIEWFAARCESARTADSVDKKSMVLRDIVRRLIQLRQGVIAQELKGFSFVETEERIYDVKHEIINEVMSKLNAETCTLLESMFPGICIINDVSMDSQFTYKDNYVGRMMLEQSV